MEAGNEVALEAMVAGAVFVYPKPITNFIMLLSCPSSNQPSKLSFYEFIPSIISLHLVAQLQECFTVSPFQGSQSTPMHHPSPSPRPCTWLPES